jgi:hypothetical protein
MFKATADRVIMEDVNHRTWIVYAKDGIITHQRKVYKSFKPALDHANKLLHYYQVANLTELSRVS